MTKDKTVTMSRELAERLSVPMLRTPEYLFDHRDALDELRALLAAPVVERQDCVIINGMYFSHKEILEWREKNCAELERQEPVVEQYRVVRHDPRDQKYSDWFEIKDDAKREQIAVDLRFTASRDEPPNYESRKLYASPPAPVAVVLPDVDALAQIIRMVDGNHSLGAGALAERILDKVKELNQ